MSTTIIAAAEQLLTNRYNVPIRLIDVDQISEEERRNRLLRATVENPPPLLPSSLIIKQVVAEQYNPDDSTSWDTRRFFQDWAGAQFLSGLPGDPGHGPHFYGGDRALGFIILEDLGRDHRSLVEPLLHEDAASAERALLKYITRLGQLHADTIGRAAEFQQLLHAANPALAATSLHPSAESLIQQFIERLESLGIQQDDTLLAELQAVFAQMEQPGDFTAYIHADPCPDNIFYTGETLRLIDFEFGRFGHALIDANYGRFPFPTCWCCNRLPNTLVTKLENSYRAALVVGCPAAADDAQFYRALTAVSAYSLIISFSWLLTNALEKDSTWGIASVRARILTWLEIFTATATTHNELPATRGAAGRLLDLLQAHWPETDPLPLYPAFR
ncbi:MAG: phosphotransferase [Caldilineaceae bacterium]